MTANRQKTREEVNRADLKAIAFYLPQFHPIPENDQWWGEGFTEWINVKKAKPLFEGHWQPRIPADLGYYDLRDPQVRREQARLAKTYGLHGFCYYYYWFNGKKLLDFPLQKVLESGEPDFPFCMCYANENWTRAWDGLEQDILIKQEHSPENDLRFIHDIIPILRDPRYIKVNNKPLLLVYRAHLFPDPRKTAELWRAAVKSAGLDDLYLCKCEAFGDYVPPEEIGFDANVEFPPLGVREIPRLSEYEERIRTSQPLVSGYVYDYETAAHVIMSRKWPDYRLFRGIMLGWDNTARRREGPTIYHHFSPEVYEEWLAFISKQSVQQHLQEERIVFINAWNEWAEGTYLEPDQKYGLRCLEATKRAIESAEMIQHRGARIGDLKTYGGKLAEVLWYRDARIGDLETHTNNMAAHITNLEAVITDKDMHITHLEAAITDKDMHIGNLEAAITDKDLHIGQLAASLGEKEAYIELIHSGHGWKLLNKYFRMRDKLLPVGSKRRTAAKVLFRLPWLISKENADKAIQYVKKYGLKAFLLKSKERVIIDVDNPYQQWMDKNEPNPIELKKQREVKFSYEPKISIIVPTYNTPENLLKDMIESVLDQSYSNWELCIADGSMHDSLTKEVLKEYSRKDSRIKVSFLSENKGIAGNSNEALSLASGDYIAFLDHDDELSPDALYEVVSLLNEKPETEFIYSDEDKMNEKGERYEPHFKPDWSPDTFRSYNYICHFTVIRKALVDKGGGFRPGFDGSQDYDLFLRATERTKHIEHIPKILYHWRSVGGSAAGDVTAKTYAFESAKKALREHLERVGLHGEVQDGPFLRSYRTTYRIEGSPLVSIIIPTRDKVDLLKTCLESVAQLTSYPSYEIVVIDNQSESHETFRYYDELKEAGRVRLLQYSEPFNFAAINNYAVKEAKGDHLLFLNNDTEVITPDWIEQMLMYSLRKDIGAVGAKLYYPDGSIQHAGVIVGLGGVAGHSHKYFSRASAGYFSRLEIVQNLSAVTAACIMVRRDVFDEAGGFDESFSHAFNDVDLCLKIRQKGYLIVFTPYAELYHHESKTRGYEDSAEKQERFKGEIALFRQKWRHFLEQGDPYYNPNLTLDKEDFSIKL
ncbi:MAG: glycoside hydrolase family 99-like domain-containing protein [Dissulfurispiraceae bacterium]